MLLDVLCRYAAVERPALVVDLGSGTGLSARAWTGRAERVVGVEPDDGMRAVAAERGGGVEYVAASADATGLPDACADVVTISQALHWMDPGPTFAEVGRILRPGGVLAAYDYDPVPAFDAEVERAFDALLQRAQELRRADGRIAPWAPTHYVEKPRHLENMRAAGIFSYVRELQLHAVEDGDAERVVGLLRSYGAVAMHEDALDLDGLARLARARLGGRTVPFVIGYRVRLGVR